MSSTSPTLSPDPSLAPILSSKSLTSEAVALLIAQAAQNKKAEDLVIMDLRGIQTSLIFMSFAPEILSLS
jgi:hypothetical protein